MTDDLQTRRERLEQLERDERLDELRRFALDELGDEPSVEAEIMTNVVVELLERTFRLMRALEGDEWPGEVPAAWGQLEDGRVCWAFGEAVYSFADDEWIQESRPKWARLIGSEGVIYETATPAGAALN